MAKNTENVEKFFALLNGQEIEINDQEIEITNRLFKIAKESICSICDMLDSQWFQMDPQNGFERLQKLNSISKEVFKLLVSITDSAKNYEVFIEEEA